MPFSADVADREDQPIGIKRQEIVIVAAHRACRTAKAVYFERR